MNGSIFNIQRFCTDDGPGIRTTVFLKGCPLRCVWCHNPESQEKRCELMYDGQKCVACGRCAVVCPQKCHLLDAEHKLKRKLCIGCGACANVCPDGALKLYGKSVSVDEVYLALARDKVFYETSGGGVTVSGGEPLFQSSFTAALLEKCRENGIHTAMETSGFADERVFLSVAKHCDLILFDIKETDEKLHLLYTGAPLHPIIRNLRIADQNKIPILIRAPLIPTLNDREAHLKSLADLRDSLENCLGLQIMPYHKTGSYKYELLGKEYGCMDIVEPTKEMVASWNEWL